MNQNYDIITILILAYHILPEINEESRIFLVKNISFLYEQPNKLLEIVENIVNKHFTALEALEYLKG